MTTGGAPPRPGGAPANGLVAGIAIPPGMACCIMPPMFFIMAACIADHAVFDEVGDLGGVLLERGDGCSRSVEVWTTATPLAVTSILGLDLVVVLEDRAQRVALDRQAGIVVGGDALAHFGDVTLDQPPRCAGRSNSVSVLMPSGRLVTVRVILSLLTNRSWMTASSAIVVGVVVHRPCSRRPGRVAGRRAHVTHVVHERRPKSGAAFGGHRGDGVSPDRGGERGGGSDRDHSHAGFHRGILFLGWEAGFFRLAVARGSGGGELHVPVLSGASAARAPELLGFTGIVR